MKIKYVNGFKIRNTIDPDFGGHMTSAYAPYIPKEEVWVEDYLKPEMELILDVIKQEKKFFRQKKTFDELRDFLNKKVRQNGPPPPFYKRTQKESDLTIAYINGAIVRSYLDPYFIFGGHDLAYDYIPKNEIWIDDLNYPEDQSFALVHELFERQLMKKGRDYDSAHDFAIAEEKHYRRLKGVADFIKG